MLRPLQGNTNIKHLVVKRLHQYNIGIFPNMVKF
jgi:hypothetical protein